jgi:Holin of 3TMs, for gene-transfer release
MSLDLTGLGATATAAQKILGMIFPDKTEVELAKLSAALSLVTAQTSIDQAEATSSDPLQHWRGGMGWVCVAGYAYNFILQPLTVQVSEIIGRNLPLHPLDIGPLATLTLGMLGLGALHVVGEVNGVK